MTDQEIIAPAKPICVVYIPVTAFPNSRNMWNDCREMVDDFEKTKPDYYWFVQPDFDEESKRIEFKTFYAKDLTETSFAEFKKLIEEKLQTTIDN